jgi:hypothetical protein
MPAPRAVRPALPKVPRNDHRRCALEGAGAAGYRRGVLSREIAFAVAALALGLGACAEPAKSPSATPAPPLAAAPTVAFVPESEAVGMTAPRLLSGTNIVIPPELREKGLNGRVIARCVIELTGALSACRIVKSEVPEAEGAVLAALGTRRYTQATYLGNPQRVYYTIPFNFKIPPAPKPEPPSR